MFLSVHSWICSSHYKIESLIKGFAIYSKTISPLAYTVTEKNHEKAFIKAILDALEKLRKATINFIISVCSSVRLHGTIRLSLDVFSWNFIFEDFSKIHRRCSSYVKFGDEWRVFHTKPDINLWSYLAKLFLEWKISQSQILAKIKTYILYRKTFFFRKLCRLWDNAENIVERCRPHNKMAHAHCLLDT